MSATQPFETLHKDRDSALRRALRRNAFAATGLFGLALCAMIAGALATWHVADPSLSNATEIAPRNFLGLPGAMISDLMIQTFGLGSAFLLIPPVIWFWRLVRIHPMRITRIRSLAWLGGLAAIAIAFSTIPAPNSWPLPISLGGMIGDGFLAVISMIDPHFINGLGAIIIGTAFCAGGILLLLNSVDTTWRQLLSRRRAPVQIVEEEEDYFEDDNEYGQSYEQPDPAYAEQSHASDDQVLDRTQNQPRKLGPLAIARGAIGHWLLARKAQKQRPASQTSEQMPVAEPHPAPMQDPATQYNHMPATHQQPSRPLGLWAAIKAQLAGEEDDGLQTLANRQEPHMGAAPYGQHPAMGMGQAPTHAVHPTAHGHMTQNSQTMQAPLGYQEQPMAQHDQGQNQGRNFHQYDQNTGYPNAGHEQDPAMMPDQGAAPWEDASTEQTGPVGMAPPSQLARETQAPVQQAVTNEQVQSKTMREGVGKRMVRAAKNNTFIRKQEFQFPPMSFLEEPKSLGPNAGLTADQLEHNARLLEGVLSDFGIRGEIIKVRPGPVVTLYELEPAPGIKSSRVIGLADDIARSMSAISARVAVVPGRNAIGIELPNARRETVYLRELLSSSDFEKSKAKLPICLGKNIGGDPVIADLARMPHVLVAGTTGSGKSVSINTTIMSLLYRHTPEQCRLIMIDPKMLELSIYDGIPHLLTPVVTDPSKAVVALKWAVREMEQRYKHMSKMGVRNIDGFNNRVRQSLAKGEAVTRTVQTGFDPETGDPIYEQEELNLEPMPYIVIIVDEMADLMMVAGKDIEGAIQRLAQMARAAGIHLIMATQRPSVDVITGTIKANFPTRMSFQVTSKIDSRTILGEMGAEQLLGMGDMLYMAGGGRTQRVHGPFVADEEVEEIVKHLKLQGVPDYLEAVTEDTEEEQSSGDGSGSSSGGEGTLYDKAVDIVLRDRKASTSYIQRRLSIGYNRAATLIEQMEQEGVISAANHAGKREILVPEEGATM
ncbi:DNA translocase FtsK 4TM domain-containing protein [Cohaesibacter gelatinilyticus]|uniref:DNA translocase FtsK n=1 Tax=Cohaesibacter gelatinilyticus TaxID=372072 RepID=A0A285PDH3_9HYPH|nr:DNA translocase FtsK 4TM domain-containing protein [Cohaesibacter gelatinilyticus]SNZ19759.1 DNA segregation ATPase FtsK/SpoIIIE, S-DNA-T family [Cohaesibacter gelatinilyticus]